MQKKTLNDVDVKGKKVFMRVDFNVPLDKDLNVTDDTRIKAALPSIKYIIDNGGKLILASHLGRPKGKVVEEFRLNPAAKKLQELLGKPVLKLDDCIGDAVAGAVNNMQEGDVIVLENLRFHPEEEANDENFAKQLASLADIYVNDAFGTCHRAHASTAGIAKFLPAYAGFLVEKEIEYLGNATQNPQKPFVAVMGGAKVADKIPMIENLIDKVDVFIIGGGMCYTFLKAQGVKIGASKLEEDKVDLAKSFIDKIQSQGKKILLPIDHVIGDKFAEDAHVKTVEGDIEDGWMGLDIGPETIKLFEDELKNSKTVVWNGPMGVFEMKPFAEGTKDIAQCLANTDTVSILGGGDTAAAASAFGVADKMTHISTGGGASLEFLQGKELPGIAALLDK